MVCRIGAFSMRRSALCGPGWPGYPLASLLPGAPAHRPGLAGGSWLRGHIQQAAVPALPARAVLPSQRSRIYSSFCGIGQCTVLDGKYDIAPLVGAQHRAAPGLQLCQHTGAWMAVGVASPHADDAILGVGGIQQLGTGGSVAAMVAGLEHSHRFQAANKLLFHRAFRIAGQQKKSRRRIPPGSPGRRCWRCHLDSPPRARAVGAGLGPGKRNRRPGRSGPGRRRLPRFAACFQRCGYTLPHPA